MKTLIFFTLILSLIACAPGSKTDRTESNTAEKNIKPSLVKVDSGSADEPKSVAENTLFEITGNYILEQNEANCKIKLKLYYENHQLRYELLTSKKKFADKAQLELNEEKDGYYITFKNIEWSENEGALNDEGEPIDQETTLPQDIQGTMYKNEITIQNYGNSMNYYVKLEGCDLKYIHLVRK